MKRSEETTKEGRVLLDDFGRMFAKQIDTALRETDTELARSRSPSHATDAALRQYLESSTDDQRALKVARLAVQKFAHNLLATLDGDDVFALVATDRNGNILDLKKYSDLFAAEPTIWFQKYSEHGSVASDILETAEHFSC